MEEGGAGGFLTSRNYWVSSATQNQLSTSDPGGLGAAAAAAEEAADSAFAKTTQKSFTYLYLIKVHYGLRVLISQ